MVFTLLQKMIDHLITYEPGMHSVLQKHQEKVLALEVEGLQLHFYFTILDNGIYLSSSLPPKIHAQISGRPFTLTRLLLNHDLQLLRNNPYLKMTGDTQFCNDLFKAWKEAEFDWQACLSAISHPHITTSIHHLLKATKNFFTTIKTQLYADIEEYIHYENKFLVRQEEMETYFAEISTLTHAFARLQARLQHLNTLINHHAPS